MGELRPADFRELFKRLIDNKFEFVVIGGVAASLPRFARGDYEVDVCAPLHEENVSRLLDALRDLCPRFRARPDKLPVPDDITRLTGVKNLYLLTNAGVIDVLGELPGVCSFGELAGKTVELNVGGFFCRVLDLDTLIASKNVAGRDKDKLNVLHLEAIRQARQSQPGLFDSLGQTPPES